MVRARSQELARRTGPGFLTIMMMVYFKGGQPRVFGLSYKNKKKKKRFDLLKYFIEGGLET